MSPKELESVRRNLPYRYADKVRRQVEKATGKEYSLHYIRNVVQGRFENSDILDAIVTVADEERKRRAERNSKIEQMTQEDAA